MKIRTAFSAIARAALFASLFISIQEPVPALALKRARTEIATSQAGEDYRSASAQRIAAPPAYPTRTVITSDLPDPSRAGKDFTVTIEVGWRGGSAPGWVTLFGYPGEPCTIYLLGGRGRCQIRIETPGAYTLTATYPGYLGGAFQPSSDTERHIVNDIRINSPVMEK